MSTVSARRMYLSVSPSVWRCLKLGALGALTIVILAALRNVDWAKTESVLSAAKPGWIVLAIIANTAILPCWALFWQALRPRGEQPVSFARMLDITSISSALMNTLPFGGGHASAVVLLIKRANT